MHGAAIKVLHNDSCCVWTDIVIFKIYQYMRCNIAPVSAL